MKTISKTFLALAVVAMVASSCSNSDMESRIARLEGKVAALEGKGLTPTAAKPIAVNNPATPAVEEKPEGPLPAFKFQEEIHDFGTIKDGDIVEHTFTFVNDGEVPLVISAAKGSCGCTVPDWTKEPIAVGATGEIKVKFNSKGKPGIQNKTVDITANTWPATHRLRIKANVIKEDS